MTDRVDRPLNLTDSTNLAESDILMQKVLDIINVPSNVDPEIIKRVLEAIFTFCLQIREKTSRPDTFATISDIEAMLQSLDTNLAAQTLELLHSEMASINEDEVIEQKKKNT
jgi:hypothetical protein